jgi:hypothetical protein
LPPKWLLPQVTTVPSSFKAPKAMAVAWILRKEHVKKKGLCFTRNVEFNKQLGTLVQYIVFVYINYSIYICVCVMDFTIKNGT